jgi:hypothetical protein
MIRNQRIALVSADAGTRRTLRDYLASVGFEVEECVDLAVAAAYSGIVMVSRDDAGADVVKAQVRAWLKATKMLRVVVVTSKPAAFRELLLAFSPRLVVLAAPAFGWDVADALRGVDRGPLPRGA